MANLKPILPLVSPSASGRLTPITSLTPRRQAPNIKRSTNIFFGDRQSSVSFVQLSRPSTTWSLEGFQRPAHKHALMRAFVDGDIDALEYEIQRVNALMESQPSLIVIPAHDYQTYPQESIYPDAISSK